MRQTISVLVLLCAANAAAAQDLWKDLATFAGTPAVTGYEHALAEQVRARLKSLNPKTDNLGNLYVTLGNGAPHHLLVAPMDEPGYIVSGITDDGYLRVQRLGGAPHPLFDQLHSAQPIVIHTRKGKWVAGVVAGLSTHLQGGRREAPRVTHPDEIYVDIGASNPAEVRQAGVDFLDPISLERQLYVLANGRMTATAIGDRFGVAALVEVLRRVDAAKLRGTLSVAFTAQQWATARGLDRLRQQIKADEVIYLGRLRRGGQAGGGGGGGGQAGQAAQQRAAEADQAPRAEPGAGVLLSQAYAQNELSRELKRLAEENKIPLSTAPSAPLPGQDWPARTSHLSIATAWPSTPAEMMHGGDLRNLVLLLEAYLTGSAQEPAAAPEPALLTTSLPDQPKAAPAVTSILRQLVESYGVSTHEGPVREAIKRLLPPWAKPETDARGNLILRFSSGNVPVKGPSVVFVAHDDEIGYEITSIAPDGRLVVRSLGGGIIEFFAGHTMLVHTTNGIRPGLMELPAGWDRADFQWTRGAQAPPLRVDVGARGPAEVEALGIKVGDSLTVPKRYRPLAGTRANGRSFDDRVGCTALVAAAWAVGPSLPGRDVTFLWAVEEEIGLRGARAAADALAQAGRPPEFVFAVDTFVSSDSPLESPRFANARIGKGFVIRAVDNSNITPREMVDKLVGLAKASLIPVQYGVTGGGNDGSAFLRHGTTDIPIAWALRYSHSPGEVVDTRDVEALARIVAAIARNW
jgi:putative aminopeptidase FrvX